MTMRSDKRGPYVFSHPAVTDNCLSCHNPHGNGQYRILNAIPNPTATSGTFTPVVAPGAVVTDSPADNPDAAESDTKNYTVIQTKGTVGDLSTYLLYADDVTDAAYGPTTGDYFHRNLPWNGRTDYTAQAADPTHTAAAPRTGLASQRSRISLKVLSRESLRRSVMSRMLH